MKKQTKIIATIGPASLDFKVFKKIIENGADYLRINTAYATKEQYSVVLKNLEKTKNCKIILDIRNSKSLLKWLNFPFDIVAVSFAETGKQMKEIQKIVLGKKLIAKIESKKGVKNFNDILKNSWGIMIARGDLGEAVSLEKVPCLQKQLTRQTLKNKKFLIVATEMLLSMVSKKNPTRAEVSDVANAVFENACATMLSEETAIGKYPQEAVCYMKRIIKQAEKCCF